MDPKIYIGVGAGLAGLGAGFAGGYLLAKRREGKRADEEINSVRDQYRRLSARKPSLEEVAEAARDEIAEAKALIDHVDDATSVIVEAGYVEAGVAASEERLDDELGSEKPDYHNAFSDAHAEKVQREFEESRAEEDEADTATVDVFERFADKPYAISIEQWADPEFDQRHSKVTLEFYMQDSVLVDERERVIDDIPGTVGELTLQSFGDRSDDPDIVYARNERLGVDYEIARIHGSYEVSVLGVHPSTKEE